MSVVSGANIVSSGLALCLDSTNPRSYSPNVFPKPLDIFGWSGTGAASCTLSRDTTTNPSPAGGIPLKMAVTGNDPYTDTYNNTTWSFANASSGQTWTVSVYIKASSAVSAGFFVFGANVSGAYIEAFNPMWTVTTDWQRYSYQITLANASTTSLQVRFEGPDSGGAGTNIWFDGVQVELGSSATSFNGMYNLNRSTWNDLSGGNYNSTMYGNVPFSVDTVSCFDFAAVTGASASAASLGFTFASNMVPTSGSFTFNCWVKNPPSNSSQVGLFSNSGSADGYRFGIGLNGCYVLIGGAGGTGYSEPTLSFNSSLSASLWYNVCMIFDRAGTNSSGTPQWQLYLNGVFQTSTNMNASQPAFTSTTPGLVRSACCGLYTGKLSNFSIYNRALSASEVSQNFNAYRGKYNV